MTRLNSGVRLMLCLGCGWLTAACSDDGGREFAPTCEPGWTVVAGECRQSCESVCPEGLQCTEGVCVACPDGECPSCGDGKLDDGEECDDGNDALRDGCAACKVDSHWQCQGSSRSECECAAGYQDKDGDGSCTATCASAALDCGARGACTDASGTALCECDPGYQDNGNDGSCKPDCDTAMLSCGAHAACTDKSGTAACVCDPGYQDNDEDGACTADCSMTDCGDDASCDDALGTATCSCDAGFQDNDENGACQVDCSQVDCGENGDCDDSSGSALCACNEGYQDNDEAGGCAPDCTTAALDCGANAHCSDASGTAACACDPDYQDNDGKDGCAPTCSKAGLSCNLHSACDDGTGTAQCVCDAHYRDPGDDGACELATCYFAPSDCGASNYCALDTESCTPLPKVPNGDFSCKSGGVCDISWDLSSSINIGNDCGGGLSFTRAAFVQASPGVNADHHATISIPVPAYATIDPPTESAGPLAVTFDTGQTCIDGKGLTCASQPSPSGPDVMVSIDGQMRQRFTAGGSNDCKLKRRTVCLDHASYGRDALISITPGSQAPMDPPYPQVMLTFTDVALVRDASCPVPGIVPFEPGDWGGAVAGTPADPFIDMTFSEFCGVLNVKTLVSWPTTMVRPALEFEVTATPSGEGNYPQVTVSGLGTFQTGPASSVFRACVPAELQGRVMYADFGGIAAGCAETAPTMQIRKVRMVEATMVECP